MSKSLCCAKNSGGWGTLHDWAHRGQRHMDMLACYQHTHTRHNSLQQRHHAGSEYHGFENISYNKTIRLRPCLWPRWLAFYIINTKLKVF
ncbi:hypothetical protein FPSE_02732 [Fusarium pseudograminearum CS3096]|uniref:Uncharacterized protein n=1 Tax=Fusarium pseudograminearum (strain CS3096) TaxID=1028729 RepID=K3VSM7_FUSPC|nr:hypothetical protein FPSE_02732 [Fusarium pseudograminearum CS3096]EKJ77088.1 hypothetical protein FPSE_02732 [Fusarium pseudograminearum CS3096]